MALDVQLPTAPLATKDHLHGEDFTFGSFGGGLLDTFGAVDGDETQVNPETQDEDETQVNSLGGAGGEALVAGMEEEFLQFGEAALLSSMSGEPESFALPNAASDENEQTLPQVEATVDCPPKQNAYDSHSASGMPIPSLSSFSNTSIIGTSFDGERVVIGRRYKRRFDNSVLAILIADTLLTHSAFRIHQFHSHHRGGL